MTASIKLHSVSLEVPAYVQRERNSRNWLSVLLGAALDPPRREMRTLLQGLNFQATEGDRIALLGLNGAGKSTLLRVLNGAYQPSGGTIDIVGSRQALLNISLGFNGEATVRENIFLRGNAMGMKTALIRELIDSILDFAGLQEKAFHRLRTLSSGQRMRLGFAISTAIQHDIILMDEWVGAGDAEFMAKAKERMHSRLSGSKIVVFASHSLGLLRDVCNRGLILDRGQLVFDGAIGEALKEYHQIVLRAQAENGGATERLQTTGALEKLSLSGRKVRVSGWALQGFVAMPTILGIEVDGVMHTTTQFTRYARRDVMNHFGLHDPVCGFEADFELPEELASAAMQRLPGLYGGNNPDRLDGPFQVAPALLSRVMATAGS